MKCPCKSDKTYENCCKPYHDGKKPETAEKLMRSRYSAYALGKTDYIIKTTHPMNKSFKKDIKEWKKEINHFIKNTDFKGLEILEEIDDNNISTVTFVAYLKSHGKDASFKEKSYFEKIGEDWLYKEGKIYPR